MATFSDLVRDINTFVSRLPEGASQGLVLAGVRVSDQLKSDINSVQWNNSTGRLANSVAYAVYDNSLFISMNDYGYYQNYGVKGTDESSM